MYVTGDASLFSHVKNKEDKFRETQVPRRLHSIIIINHHYHHHHHHPPWYYFSIYRTWDSGRKASFSLLCLEPVFLLGREQG